jgi:hypothetical protein
MTFAVQSSGGHKGARYAKVEREFFTFAQQQQQQQPPKENHTNVYEDIKRLT